MGLPGKLISLLNCCLLLESSETGSFTGTCMCL
jgi:hypothetical protein